MSYILLKHVHMTLAAASASLFLVRGMWMLAGSPMLSRGWVRRTPHLVDSLLLATAIALAWWAGLSPMSSPWLGAKIGALVAYIVLGSVALKYGKTRIGRLGAFIAAIGCFAYIVTTAVTKNPLFFI
ncbi:MAG TPA: SirB2 family protein [Telluria sp.]